MQGWPLSILIGKRTAEPILPAAYRFPSPILRLGPQPAVLPDRVAHLETVTIPAGKSYRYTMKLAEAFPKLHLGGDVKIVVQYSHTYVVRKDDPVWRGELRSLPIALEQRK